jgi:hypothetical protein
VSMHLYSRGLDQLGGGPVDEVALDLAPLVGLWVSTNKNTPGIARIRVSAEGGQLRLRAFGAASSSLCDWGEVPAAAFAINPASKQAVGFRAHYDFGLSRAMLAAYLNKRILVVDSYKDLRAENGHARCFWRDHFYEEGK